MGEGGPLYCVTRVEDLATVVASADPGVESDDETSIGVPQSASLAALGDGEVDDGVPQISADLAAKLKPLGFHEEDEASDAIGRRAGIRHID
jgi:hypothetical protein